MTLHAEKKNRSLLKRRKQAVLIAAVAIVLLAVALVFVLDYVNSITVTDVDGSDYYIRKKGGVYGLYDGDDVLLKVDDVYGFYQTAAGSLIKVNAETGVYEIFAVVDTEGNETYEVQSRLQIFPFVDKKNIRSIEVVNSHGGFTFCRMDPETGKINNTSDFVLKQSPLTDFDQELFASLYVGAGYSLTLQKIKNPIVDENGEYSEYGLTSEMRINEDGEEYLYEPAYYVLTATDGTKHKVIIGDAVVPSQFTASDGLPVTMGGFYAQYVDMSGETEVKRQAVYVLDEEMVTVLIPVEEYITPLLTYPMSANDYYSVENFTISQLLAGATAGDADPYEPTVSFSYIDMAEREDTMLESFPYEFHLGLSGYTASSTTLNECLQAIYEPNYVKVCKFQPSLDDLVDYGLYGKTVDAEGNDQYHIFSPYTIAFKYVMRNQETGALEGKVHQIVLLSEKNENGNYYAYTILNRVITDDDGSESYEFENTYQMILEVEGSTLAFLEWDRLSWISKQFMDDDLCFVQDITIESPEYNASFEMDNSQSDMTADMRTGSLSILGEDSLGNLLKTFGRLVVTDKSGYTWHITATGLEVYQGETKMDISKSVGYYANNKMGAQARCRTGYIECADYRVEVNADTVRVIYNSGKEETMVRYSTNLFREFYKTLLYTAIMDSYEMTPEEETALLNDPDAWLMTITIRVDDSASAGAENATSRTDVYKFYRISSRKAYITINGEGGFYVLTSRLEKILSDAQKFFALEEIDSMTKS